MNRTTPQIFLAVYLFVSPAIVTADPDEGAPPTTIEVYQSLAAEAAAEMAGQLHPADSLRAMVSVEPAGSYWYIEEAIAQTLKSKGLGLVPSGGAWKVDCGVKEARVRYANVRRDGLLGSKLVDRTASLILWMRVSSREPAVYLFEREWQLARTDTIAVGDIQRVENPSVVATRGVLPPEGFFSSWLEPLIVVGAIGVAIFLLFTTRS